MGVELAVHGYDPVDVHGLSRDETGSQFSRATAAFRTAGIRFDGFRSPYLGCTDETRDIARETGCAYSSNSAIQWNVVDQDRTRTAAFEQLCSFYRPSSSGAMVSAPRLERGLVEIPASIPDDLQFCEGLGYSSDAAARAWLRIFDDVYRRGELFVLLFHPEAFERCGDAIERVVEAASLLRPSVWMATLRDIASWWAEKSSFCVRTTSRSATLEITAHCSAEATVLVRALTTSARTRPWMDRYQVVSDRTLWVSSQVRPFIGVAPNVPPETIDFLTQQGYILETGETASRCGMYLDAATLQRRATEVELIEHIEHSDAPLMRFWRWPREARSALAVTGDLDALSLMDYAVRILTM